MTIAETKHASTTHPILSVLQERWSPRAYHGSTIDETALATSLEAARWSPSAYNAQPWRFIVTRKGSASFNAVVSSLTEFNQDWAAHAPVLIVAVAALTDETGREAPSAVYDLGQAVAHFSVQAHAEGLHVHQQTGFDPAAVATHFGLRDGLLPFSVVAVGTLGDIEALPAGLREREGLPRERKPLNEIVIVND